VTYTARISVADVSLRLLVLKTHDVSSVVAFYQSLGLKFTEEQHGKGALHHSAALGDAIIEIYPLPNDHAVDVSVRLGFAIADPHAAGASADSVGGRVIKPGRDTPLGYMALLADPDGRTVELYRA
jgi:lactoylglutathione lyase